MDAHRQFAVSSPQSSTQSGFSEAELQRAIPAAKQARKNAANQQSSRPASTAKHRGSARHSSAGPAAKADSAPAIVFGNAGDHALVHELLRAAGITYSPEDGASWLDEPSYEPADRLVVRSQGRLVAHVQMLFRTAWFAGIKLPIAGLLDLVALPEYQLAGYERRLLAAAEDAMCEEGAIVSFARTANPKLYAAAGWTPARNQGCSRANSRDILSHLMAQPTSRRRSRRLEIRSWRHVELEGLIPVYRVANRHQWGALHRSEAYWRWLIGRKAHHELIVAVPVTELRGDGCQVPRIVGYAVTQGSHVVELHCRPGHEAAGLQLLARACRDAIERDHHTIVLHTPARDPLHELLVTAGGAWETARRPLDGTLMCKLLDPYRWVESLYPELHRRAKAAGLTRPCEIGFQVADRRFRFRLTRRSSRLFPDHTVSDDVRCDACTFSTLLLGNLDIVGALQRELLDATNGEVADKLTALFPPMLTWQSPFDTLRF